MKFPVCRFDLESDILCPNCQEKVDNGEITGFDVEFSKWLIAKDKEYPALADVQLRRAIRLPSRLILILNKKQKDILLSAEPLLAEIAETFGGGTMLQFLKLPMLCLWGCLCAPGGFQKGEFVLSRQIFLQVVKFFCSSTIWILRSRPLMIMVSVVLGSQWMWSRLPPSVPGIWLPK